MTETPGPAGGSVLTLGPLDLSVSRFRGVGFRISAVAVVSGGHSPRAAKVGW